MTPSPGDAIGASAVVPLTAPAPRPTGRPALPAPGRPESGPSWSADGIEEVPTTAGGAVPAELTDRFGRGVRDLRLSVTDRCNLRCTYCMPEAGPGWLPTASLLDAREIARLARIAVERLGVERIRLTGGEPLMRRDLEEIVAAVASLRTRRTGAKPDIGLTTNGLGLDRRAAGLRTAGLDRVNVSIDTLDAGEYAAITRRDRLDGVLRGVVGAQEAGLGPIKINAVAMPGSMGRRAPRLLAECLRRGWQLRFIEHMPLGPRESWRAEDVVGAARILAELGEAGFALREVGRSDRRPASLWHVAAGAADGVGEYPAGSVGIIASVTAPFCADCDRTRITADGRLMTCLFSARETDLRGPMRAGASDDELIRVWAGATWHKPLAHGANAPGPASGGFVRPGRTMSAIGG